MIVSSQPSQSCPACASAGGAPFGRPATGFDVRGGDSVYHQPEYVIIRCQECALHYKLPAPDSETLGDYYSRLEFESYESNRLFPTDKEVVEILGRLPDGSRVLDFGCGIGRILHSSVTRLECHGVEVNERAAAVAAERGVIMHSESALMDDARLGFDAIILTDVFEHLVMPTKLLECVSKKLARGGRLIIVTGNADAIQRPQLSSEFWYYRILGHLQMASEAHLEWLAGRLGLELEKVVHACHYDMPWRMRIKQRLQSWAYACFQLDPRSITTSILRCIPVINRAKSWPCAPAYSSGRDHFVAVFINR